MSTILEIQKPELTYCQKYDIHCACPKCTDLDQFCLKTHNPNHCSVCIGPIEEDEEEIKWYNDRHPHNKLYIGGCSTLLCQYANQTEEKIERIKNRRRLYNAYNN